MSNNHILEVICLEEKNEIELMVCPECYCVTDRLISGVCPSCFTRDIIAHGSKRVEWDDLPENRYFTSMAKIAGYSRGLTSDEMKKFATPKREPCVYHDDFEATFGESNTNTMHEAFRKAELMDTEQGAGALNKTKLTAALDPELQARAMPGKSTGWTADCKKPKCPIHKVTVTEYGYCPVCKLHYRADRQVVIRHNKNGYTQTKFNSKKHPAMDQYEHPVQCEIHAKEDGVDIPLGKLNWETEWLKHFEESTYLGIVINHVTPIGKANFDGQTHKKSSGPSILILDYNVKQVFNNDKPTYHRVQDVPVRRVKRELRGCPECGSTFSGKDLRRGESLCPQCGLVKGKIMITQKSTRDGNDDKDYGGD
jgi:hypothetical protein